MVKVKKMVKKARPGRSFLQRQKAASVVRARLIKVPTVV